MGELFAVYIESLDQDLRVYEDEKEANARYEELKAEGKPVKIEKFGRWQMVALEKANGCSAKDTSFWEEIRYDNGRYILTERYEWHKEPDEEGYYADYYLS